MPYIIVTSRSPYSYDRIRGKINKRMNIGGVAIVLNDLISREGGTWVCWGDGTADHEFQEEDNGKFRISRILLTIQERRGFYDEYSNSTLWPLFHYFREKIQHDQKYFKIYQKVNELFAAAIEKSIRNKDEVIWIHDYQLSLVPGFLKERGVTNPIIFTWHIPWVSDEFYSILPERELLLKSISSADSITFHTKEYRTNFRDSYEKIIGDPKNVDRKLHYYPLGIDYKAYEDIERFRKIPLAMHNTKIIFSIDRLDYTKGLIARVKAIESLLRNNPELSQKFMYLMIVTPSRTNVGQYMDLKNELEMNIGRINGEYGRIGWYPITYIYRKVSQKTLINYYKWADIALITPLIDGLNLVCKEFIAASNKGLLILSEFAGSAEDLDGAVKVNPNSIENLSSTLFSALSMPESEIMDRLNSLKEKVRRRDIQWWARKVTETIKRKESNV
ncbi:MAG: alpha,alpha-trehalose-phosphate synthase (UDP-forming) [Thermoplasmataceae archaeon]